MSAPVECRNASASSSRVSGLRTRIGFPATMLSGRLSHWSTLKTVYSRIMGMRRVAELSSWSRDLQLLYEINLRAALALAHVATQLQRLLESEKARRAIAGRLRHPQQNDVAAGVRPVAHGIARGIRAGCCRPWLNPRGGAGF